MLLVSWHVTPYFWGGANLALDMARRLDAAGWTRTRVLTVDPEAQAPRTESLGGLPVARIHPPAGPWGRLIGGAPWWYGWQVLRAMVRDRADTDLVHVLTVTRFSFAVVVFARLLRRPVVLESLIPGAVFPPGGPRSALDRLKVRLKVAVLGLAGRVVCRSDALAADCHAAGISAERIVVCPYGIDGDRFRPAASAEKAALRARLGLEREAKIVIFVGGINARKGVDRIVEAFGIAAGSVPKAHLLLVGPVEKYDPAFLASLDAAIAGQGLSGRVTMTRRAVANVEDYMRAADVFIFASRVEGFGAVVVEAMAAGLPVVTVHIPDVTETQVIDGETGYVARDGSPAALAERLIQVLRLSVPERAVMGAAARKKALEDYGTVRNDSHFGDIYHQLVNDWHRRTP